MPRKGMNTWVEGRWYGVKEFQGRGWIHGWREGYMEWRNAKEGGKYMGGGKVIWSEGMPRKGVNTWVEGRWYGVKECQGRGWIHGWREGYMEWRNAKEGSEYMGGGKVIWSEGMPREWIHGWREGDMEWRNAKEKSEYMGGGRKVRAETNTS